MSYNTRRSGNFGAGAPQNAQSVGGIGQRRPVVTNNFVPSNQLNTQKSGVQVPHQRVPNTNTSVNFRNQNQGYQTQQQPQQQQPIKQTQQPQQQQLHPVPQVQQHQQPPKAAQPAQITQVEQKPIIPGVNPPNPALEDVQGEGMEVDQSEIPKKKPFWIKAGKISRKEKMRRRNVRLSKMLQPKNAVMILNELVKNTSYVVEELPVKTDTNQFQASVNVENIEHVGYGRSKIHAKNSAAEEALRYLIKSNKISEMKKDEEGNEKMDVAEDESQPPLPWQHVASFALYKLFTSWGEDPNKPPRVHPPQLDTSGGETPKQHENKPAKKMPENPDSMNPLMLINQMLPHAQFEEIGKSGTPPTVIYSYRCSVNEEGFIGTGPNKKAAKRLAAFAACHKILNVSYPKEVYEPVY